MELADGIVARQKVQGRIRCAQVEYTQQTKTLITYHLKVKKVPTLQLYCGLSKLWEVSGKTDTKELRAQLSKVEHLSTEELLEHAESLDDGILQGAIEDSFYESPSFLNEEW
jgi:hypothetical protein